MRNLTNSILINNNLKSGKVDSALKTIELLAKLGLLPKKKKPTKKIIGYDETGEPIRQNNKMVGSVSYGPPMDKTGPTPSKGPLTIEDINRERKEMQKQIEYNPPKNSEELKQLQLQLALLNDSIQNTKEEQKLNFDRFKKQAIGYVGERLSNIGNNYIFPNESISEMPEKINPFDNKQETNIIETDEQDFTNQGSQDIPENILNVDVSASPNEIIEDQEDNQSLKSSQIGETPTDDKLLHVEISANKLYIPKYTQDIILSKGIKLPDPKGKYTKNKKPWKKEDIIKYMDIFAFNFASSWENNNIDLNKKSVKELYELLSDDIASLGLFYSQTIPSNYNEKTNRWEFNN